MYQSSFKSPYYDDPQQQQVQQHLQQVQQQQHVPLSASSRTLAPSLAGNNNNGQSSLITKSMVIRPPANENHILSTSSNNTSSASTVSSSPVTDPSIVKEIIQSGGQTIVKDYRQGEFLGKGGFAKCYLMTEVETNRIYAAKIVPKSTLQKSRARAKLKTEIRIHSSLCHENIVKFEHCFENEENVYILLGLCNQKTVMDLHKRRKFLLECEVKYYVYQVIMAVKYLHAHKIIHRDLKLGNLFIDNMRIKLGDFGLSTKVEHEGERKKTICGTPNYIAPEVLDNANGHSYEVDIWSIGIILYTLLIGKPPFETPDVRNTYQRIRQNQYAFPDEPVISPYARALIVSILNPVPEKRPNLNQILENDFFCLSTIPKYLPTSALTTMPIMRPAMMPLSENNNIVNQITNSPSKQLQQPVSSMILSPHKKTTITSNAIPLVTLSPNSQQKLLDVDKDDFHYRKLRRLEKMKENETLYGFPASLVFIEQFADFSNKYGLGYSLSNGSIGAYFNDSTKVISFIDTGIAHYMEHAKGTEGDGRRILEINENHPHDTQKKVTLIKYFATHFGQQTVKFTQQQQQQQSTLGKSSEEMSNPVYVKKWIKTSKGIAFRLSDRTIQVNFYDKSIIIITKDQMVTYVASDETTIKTDKLSCFLQDLDTKIVGRIKYTREILINLYNKKPDDNA
eukprot:gene16784-19961_t